LRSLLSVVDRSRCRRQMGCRTVTARVMLVVGVEVADIKRMNGLATDIQMFALQMLRIPLPGRHPPSPVPSEPAKLREKAEKEDLPA
ncbi:hypothetical protein RYX36_009265, partial [Vicia faba]